MCQIHEQIRHYYYLQLNANIGMQTQQFISVRCYPYTASRNISRSSRQLLIKNIIKIGDEWFTKRTGWRRFLLLDKTCCIKYFADIKIRVLLGNIQWESTDYEKKKKQKAKLQGNKTQWPKLFFDILRVLIIHLKDGVFEEFRRQPQAMIFKL